MTALLDLEPSSAAAWFAKRGESSPKPGDRVGPAEDDGAGDCADSTSWFNKKTSRDCGYVAKKTSKRCDLEAEDGVSGFEGCRETCGDCR